MVVPLQLLFKVYMTRSYLFEGIWHPRLLFVLPQNTGTDFFFF